MRNIDRLVVVRRNDTILAADIIDYKTDQIAADASVVQERVRFYRPQMLAYRRAIGRMLRLTPDRIAVRLAFVLADTVVHVPFASAESCEVGELA